MLFKNLKTSNFVEAKDNSAIAIMKKSPIYEAVSASAQAPKAETPAKKKGRKPKE